MEKTFEAKTPASEKIGNDESIRLPINAINKNSTMAQELNNETSKSDSEQGFVENKNNHLSDIKLEAEEQGFVENKNNHLSDIKLEAECDDVFEETNISSISKLKSKGTIAEPGFIVLHELNAMETSESNGLDCFVEKQIPIVIKVEPDDSTVEVKEMDKHVYEEWKGKNEEINIKQEENGASIFPKKRRHFLQKKHPKEVVRFKCEQCSFQSPYKTSLKLHLIKHKNTEASVSNPKCDQCKCEADRKNNLKNPLVKQKSSIFNRVKCDQCNFQSPYKTSLKLHLIKHKGSKEVDKFKCDQCK